MQHLLASGRKSSEKVEGLRSHGPKLERIKTQASRPEGAHAQLDKLRAEREKALRDREELLELFFSQSLDGFFFMMLDEPILWDDAVDKEETLDYVFAHQRITKVNDAMLEQYGSSREQFLGMTPGDFYAHDIACGRDIWKRCFDAGRLHVETEERKLDGAPIWIEGDYICLYDSDGRITGHFGIQRDITDRKKISDQLHNDREKLKAMTSKLLLTQERERRLLAVELHDNICQGLVLIKLALESSLHLISDTNVLGSVKIACGAIGETIEEAESLTFALSNPVLNQFGFVAALDKYLVEEIQKKYGIKCELDSSGRLGKLHDETKTCLFRVTRELLTNVVEHAHASKIMVRVRKRGGRIRVTVQDDGVGFKDNQAGPGASETTRFGLFSVREQLDYLVRKH